MIFISADHRGFALKESIKIFLKEQNIDFADLGNGSYDENDDYPDYAKLVAEKVSQNPDSDKGIVICGSGIGVSITANKFKNVRAALASDTYQARLSRSHNDANVLALSGETGEEKTKEILEVWLKTPFSGEERHKRRLVKIREIEERN